MREKILCHTSGTVDWNSESDPDRAAARRENGAIYSDDFAGGIYQRPAGVARIDRRVCLDHVDVHARAFTRRREIPASSAHHSRGNAWLRVGEKEAVRIPDSDCPLANQEVGGRPER